MNKIFSFQDNFVKFSILSRLTHGLSNIQETIDDSSRSILETTTSIAPPPSINIRLETVIKISEVESQILMKMIF